MAVFIEHIFPRLIHSGDLYFKKQMLRNMYPSSISRKYTEVDLWNKQLRST